MKSLLVLPTWHISHMGKFTLARWVLSFEPEGCAGGVKLVHLQPRPDPEYCEGISLS